MKKVGRPVSIKGINVKALQKWINSDRSRRDAIKCQALISLTKGTQVKDVCQVLDLTRETVSEWRRRLRKEGISYLNRSVRRGRQSNLTASLKKLIKNVMLKSPEKSGYTQAIWDGKLLCKFLKDQENIEISVRTAQYWIREIGFTQQRPRLSFKQASKKEKAEFKEHIKKNFVTKKIMR